MSKKYPLIDRAKWFADNIEDGLDSIGSAMSSKVDGDRGYLVAQYVHELNVCVRHFKEMIEKDRQEANALPK